MRKYTPRRAGQRWREGAPNYVLDCFDNKGKTADRYSVIYCGQEGSFHVDRGGTIHPGPDSYNNTYLYVRDMSEDPFYPTGVCLTNEYEAHIIAQWRYTNGHNRVRWLDLPEQVRRAAVMDFGDQNDDRRTGTR